jgi:2,3-diaminopropionate biosynthesis protein SbnB
MSDSLARDPTSSQPWRCPDEDPFHFSVISGETVRAIVAEGYADLVEVVRDAYLAHADGLSHNPPSQFLRFGDRPLDRIIALPADLGSAARIAGIKWIASWPENVEQGIPRASALLVLNRRDNGYPFCVMEASIISAARTAASAVLALEQLGAGRVPDQPRIGIVGCGFIARYIVDMMRARGVRPALLQAFDLNPGDARRLLGHAGPAAAAAPAESLEALIRTSDVIVFATTAARPHVTDPLWLAHCPLVLNISLRDLDPGIILSAQNVVDDVEHCLQAETSVHLAEQQSGRRDFIAGRIADAVRGTLSLDPARPLIFSPFGMGILDLAVGSYVHRLASRTGRATTIPGFFGEQRRW